MLALAFLLSVASPVEEARQLNREATLRYDVRDFEGALQKYKRAYELTPLPGLLFNIAQCHKQLRQHDKAIFYFQGFLRNDPGSSHREVVEQMIAEEQRAQAHKPARVVMPTMKPTPVREVVTAPVYEKWWFWTAIGASAVVVAGVVTGVAVAMHSSSTPQIGAQAGSLGLVDRR